MIVYAILLIYMSSCLVIVLGVDNSTSEISTDALTNIQSGSGNHNSTYKTSTSDSSLNDTQSGTFCLVGGGSELEGRVEVFQEGRWGTVCHNGWDIREAGMVCRSMGYTDAVSASGEAHFGPGTGIQWSVNCPWGATTLDNCTHARGACFFGHAWDAGAVCTDCQANIGGHHELHCESCSKSSEKCEKYGCPAHLTHYNPQTQMCELDTGNKLKSYECDEHHKIERNPILSSVSSLLGCIHRCISYIDIICTGVNYDTRYNICQIFNVNKYTVPKTDYVIDSHFQHCVVGVCPPGKAMNKNNTCSACPLNTYKLNRGTSCMPCEPGYDTNNMTGAAKCNKTCTAGYHSLDGVYCEACPSENYKKHNDGSQCLQCKKYTTTGGKVGSLQCESVILYYLNLYGLSYICVLSAILAVGTRMWNTIKYWIKNIHLKYKNRFSNEQMQISPSSLSSVARPLNENENIRINPLSMGINHYKIIHSLTMKTIWILLLYLKSG